MRQPKFMPTGIHNNEGFEGESIEIKIKRFINGEEPITDASPTIFQLRKEGVQPAYDIRADKWALAQAAMAEVHNKYMEQRRQNIEKWNPDVQPNNEGDA